MSAAGRQPGPVPRPRGAGRAPLPGSHPCPGRAGRGERWRARGAAVQGLCGVSADIVNADKMSGRSRKYKIIFSPQKVSGTRGAAHSPVTLCPPSLCTFHPSTGANNCLFLTQKCLSKPKCCDACKALGPCRAFPARSLPGPEGVPFPSSSMPARWCWRKRGSLVVSRAAGLARGSWHHRIPVTSQCWTPRVGRTGGWAGNTGSLGAGCQPAGRCVPTQHRPLSSARGEERGSCCPSCLELHSPVLGLL